MQDIIAFQGLEALNESGATSTEMARLAQIDNKLMLDFSAKSRQDASTLKSITILTMVYLPASFASVSQNSLVLRPELLLVAETDLWVLSNSSAWTISPYIMHTTK